MKDKQSSAWFAPMRYGYGSGRPISWQGWVASVLFLIGMFAPVILLDGFTGVVATFPVVVIFLIVLATKTEGGWRWRWGEDQ